MIQLSSRAYQGHLDHLSELILGRASGTVETTLGGMGQLYILVMI